MPCKIVGGTKVPGNESSSERKVQGTKVPGNEKSPERKFPIGTIHSWERKVLGMKSPGTRIRPGVKCGTADPRILNCKMRMLLRTKIRILPIHANLSLMFFLVVTATLV